MAKLKVVCKETEIDVTAAEYGVLALLARLDCEAHGPMISRASDPMIPVVTIYGLLARLKKRGLVQTRAEYLSSGDITATRILYKLSDTCQLSPFRV